MAMKFSIFTTVHDTGGGTSPDQTLDNFREQAVLADELGYHTVWIGEHHFGP
jgi:alkanesulfonate monooxygenase SsuD/methylene tetrahydromethanopterin reductase-like flavin-dependent oxidoreductase (luciferase family)